MLVGCHCFPCVYRARSYLASVTHLVLDVGDDGTFGDGAERKNVADSQGGVLSGVDELTSVHALVAVAAESVPSP